LFQRSQVNGLRVQPRLGFAKLYCLFQALHAFELIGLSYLDVAVAVVVVGLKVVHRLLHLVVLLPWNIADRHTVSSRELINLHFRLLFVQQLLLLILPLLLIQEQKRLRQVYVLVDVDVLLSTVFLSGSIIIDVKQ
jgi:hypothetical protein